MSHSVHTERAIDMRVAIKAPPKRVFAAFIEKELLEAWFVLRAEVDPRPGGAFAFYWKEVGVTGHALEVDPPNRLVLEFDERPVADGVTVSTISVTADVGGASLHFRQVGFGDGPEWDALYDGMSVGWVDAFSDLKFFLETGEPRPGGFRNG